METSAGEGKYIYCIIESGQGRSFGPLGIGGRGDEVYTISSGDIAAVVSDSPMKKYPVSRENTLAHERAIEKAMEEHVVLPVRFSTITEDEEEIKRLIANGADATIKDNSGLTPFALAKMENKRKIVALFRKLGIRK